MKNFSQHDHITPKHDDILEDLKTNKWNPMTFAIYNGNLDLIKYLIQISLSNTKKLIKVPGLFNT